jgi:hypothetical protein
MKQYAATKVKKKKKITTQIDGKFNNTNGTDENK